MICLFGGLEVLGAKIFADLLLYIYFLLVALANSHFDAPNFCIC
jgi:hypothetical protein